MVKITCSTDEEAKEMKRILFGDMAVNIAENNRSENGYIGKFESIDIYIEVVR
jgi:hypothetical protein